MDNMIGRSVSKGDKSLLKFGGIKCICKLRRVLLMLSENKG